MSRRERVPPSTCSSTASSPWWWHWRSSGIFPTELGGLPWDELVIKVGEQNLEDQDEEEFGETEALLESLSASMDDVTTVTASRISEDFTEFTFLVAFQVSGVDADDLLEGILPSFTDDLERARQEGPSSRGGRPVCEPY